MKIYCVVQRYYENGDVIALIETTECDKKPKNTCEELERFDLYRDYFTNSEEAEHFYDQAVLFS